MSIETIGIIVLALTLVGLLIVAVLIVRDNLRE